MIYNFDEEVNRRGTYSAKWDGVPLFPYIGVSERGDADTLPLFTADMDFRCPNSVKEEIMKVAEQNLYGYTTLHPAVGARYYHVPLIAFDRSKPPQHSQYTFFVKGRASVLCISVLRFVRSCTAWSNISCGIIAGLLLQT